MTTVFWAGDSTVKRNGIETYPQTGIGQEFDRFVRHYGVQIEPIPTVMPTRTPTSPPTWRSSSMWRGTRGPTRSSSPR